MKNITVSVDDNIYHRARIRAAERKTSVSAIVRDVLCELSEEKTEFERLRELEAEALKEVFGKTFTAMDRLDRDQVHARDEIR